MTSRLRWSAPALRADPEQLHRVPAENRLLVGVAEEAGVEHEVDAHRPIERIVSPVHHLTDPGLGHQMSKTVLVEDHRVDEELAPEVLARLLLQRLAVGAKRAAAAAERIGPSGVGRQVAAGMRGTDLQARKAIERAFEDQMRQEHGGLERIANRVPEPASPLQS